MAKRDHLNHAKVYVEKATAAVERVTDPGHRAIALALIALTAAVLDDVLADRG